MTGTRQSGEDFFRARGFGQRIGFGERSAQLVIDLVKAFTDGGVVGPIERSWRRRQSWAALLAISMLMATDPAIATSHPRKSGTADSPCLITLDALSAPVPSFEAFPASNRRTGPPVAVDLDSDPAARKFRTVLREGARLGPNFAGRYTIVGWGCGASCLNWAVVDAATGKVRFDAGIDVVSTVHVENERSPTPGVDAGYNALRFRGDSDLLVVLGAPHEDEAREGIAFYRWNGNKFRLLRFVPAADACRPYP